MANCKTVLLSSTVIALPPEMEQITASSVDKDQTFPYRRRRHFAALVTLGISLLWALPSHAFEDDHQDPLRAGVGEASQGNFSSAMVDLEAAVALRPNDAEGWYQLGILSGQIGDFRRAEAMFQRSIQLQPDLAKAHYSLGLSLVANPQSKLDWPGAIAEFRAALKYQPDYPSALNYLGAGLTATGQPSLAIPELEHAVQLSPSFGAAHFNLAIALERVGRLDEAVKEYQSASGMKGGNADASSALGKLLFQMGEKVTAEAALRTALKLNPDLGDAHFALARILQASRQTSAAAIEFAQTKDLAQREPDAIESSQLSNKGLALAAKGDIPGAIVDLRKAVTLRPDYGVPHYNLGLLLADSGDTAGAVQQIKKAISLLPGQAKPWFDLGRVFRRQGNNQDALQAISWATRLAPSDITFRNELASLRTADPTLVPPSTDSVLRSPDFGSNADTVPGHLAFALELTRTGDFLGAVGEYLRCLTLEPANLDARRGLANAYQQIGDSNRATLEYNKILLVAPGDAAATAFLARQQPKPAAAK